MSGLPRGIEDALPGRVQTPDNVLDARVQYSAAETDTVHIAGVAGQRICVVAANVMAADSNTNSPAFRLGFGAANTPTASFMVSSHPGVAPGSGVMECRGGGVVIMRGGVNVPLRFTCGDPGGDLDVLVWYFLG